MKFEHQKQLAIRFQTAEANLNKYIESLAQDIKANPKMSADEMRFNLAGALAQTIPVASLIDLVAVAVHTLAEEHDSLVELSRAVTTIPCSERELPYVPPACTCPSEMAATDRWCPIHGYTEDRKKQ